MGKRFLAIVLAAVFCLPPLSFSALAETGTIVDSGAEEMIYTANNTSNNTSSANLDLDYPDPGFTDVAGTDWFYDAVRFAIGSGVMNGTSETLFEPDATLSRAMTVTVLYRIQDSPSTIYSSVFPDIQEDKWYSAAVIWASENKIVEGYDNGLFGPDDPVTREQLGVILHRYAGFIGSETNFWIRPAALESFSDGDGISGWALDAVKWCLTFDFIKGISGKSGPAFAPRGNATRAQYATILQRFFSVFIDGDGIIPLPPAQPDKDMFGIDLNINQDTIDDWLGRDDAVYRDMRMLIDTADFDAMGNTAATILKFTIKGFKVVPWPYVANSSALPSVVGNPYDGNSLFIVDWNTDGDIVFVQSNYVESLMILEELFPKDKAIFFTCGGGGYSSEMKKLLIFLGWDESRLYNTGANWNYTGRNALKLYLPSDEVDGKYMFATWRADYAIFSFKMLTPLPPDTVMPGGSYTAPPVIKGSDAPLPPADPDTAGYDVDRTINMSTIDDWLARDDVVYRDLRMFIDPTEFESLKNGTSDLTHTINGFMIVPYPFVAYPQRMPVAGGYSGSTLFSLSWSPDGLSIIETDTMANYEESIMILEELFPKDKKIFLMSGWVGYAYEMKTLLKWYGWDESSIYIVGSYWDYEGENSTQLIVPPDSGADTIFASWRADYAVINFNFLNPFPYYDGTPPPVIDPNNPGCILNTRDIEERQGCAC